MRRALPTAKSSSPAWPPARVFDAWTDPEQVVQWWGPRGFTTTTHNMEVKPGGVWRFIMHGPDGRDYQNKITYLEVARPERLVYSTAATRTSSRSAFRPRSPSSPKARRP